MKLKKVLSALTAAALAAMTLAITPITASAATIASFTNVGTIDWSGNIVIDASSYAAYADDAYVAVDYTVSGNGGQFYVTDANDWSQSTTWYSSSSVVLFDFTSDMATNGIMINGDSATINEVFIVEEIASFTNVGTIDWSGNIVIDASDYAAYADDAYVAVDYTVSGNGGQFYVTDANDWSQSTTWYSSSSVALFDFTSDMATNGIMINGDSATINEVKLLGVAGTPVTSITVTLDDSDLVVGDTTNAVAAVLPTDATDDTVTWSSSDTGVATVNSDGEVTAVASGTATITATAYDGSGVTGSATVTVTNPATAVAVGSTSVTILEGNSQEVAVTVTPADADDVSYTFESSDETVATVEESVDSVKITGVAAGTATITIALTSDSSITATIDVTVTDTAIAATAIEVTPTELSLEVGGTSTLSATLTPSDTTDSATYTSSDESVATVSSTGVVTAVAAGTATITVSANDDVSATVAVTVTVAENPVTAITVSSDSVSVLVGEAATVTATVTPADADDTTVTWASSDESVATVADGVITGVAAGTATVTASSANGLTATVAVTVTEETTTTTDDTTTTTTHTHVYDSGVKKGMYYVYTCAICGDTYEVYYANDSQWAATFWGLVGQYGTASTRTTSTSTSSEEVIEDTEVEETAAEATSSDSAYTKTMTIDATGSYWDQVALTLEELLGDIDPATVKSITISGSDTFCIGYNNADGWVQTDDDTEFELSDISFEDDVYYVAFVGRIESGTTTITWTINT